MKYNESNSYKTSQKQIAGTYKRYKTELSQAKSVLDYGAGKYNEMLTEYHKVNKINGRLYDPYNEAINQLPNETFEIVICNNVLNVVKDDEVLKNIVKTAISKAEKKVIFKVYQGDKSGKSRITGKETFQRHCKTNDYKGFFKNHEIKITGDYIVLTK